jgi:imidazoleglycerol phosphate dehydratase HisB
MRQAKIERKTRETDINASLAIEGEGRISIDSGIGLLNHMLELFSFQGIFDLSLIAKGDFDVDDHHTVEDVGFVLGLAFDKALGKRQGINRYGFFILPMDEALAQVAIDLGGRPCIQLDAGFNREKVGSLSTELIYDFFEAFSRGSRASINIKVSGRNEHHMIEAIFKAFGRAMRMASEIDLRRKNLPSTKEVI